MTKPIKLLKLPGLKLLKLPGLEGEPEMYDYDARQYDVFQCGAAFGDHGACGKTCKTKGEAAREWNRMVLRIIRECKKV